MKASIYFFTIPLLCIFIVNISYSQLDEFGGGLDEFGITYTQIYDKPERFSMLSLNIPVLSIGLSKFNFSVYNLKGGFHYLGSGRINGGFTYKLGVGDKVLPSPLRGEVHQDHVMSIYKPGHAQELDAYATYFFLEKEKIRNSQFVLKLGGNVDKKIVYIAMAKTKILVKHGVYLGYSQGYTWYNMKNIDLNLYNSTYDVTQRVNLQSMATVQNYGFIKVGYQFNRITNARFDFENYGPRNSRDILVLGANLIFALQNKFDDVYLGYYENQPNKVFYEQYEIAPTNKRLNIGAEIYLRTFEKRSFISYEARLGYLPGLMNNLNLMLSGAIYFQIDFLRNNLKDLDKSSNLKKHKTNARRKK